ncbi:MAG: hypothetical protein PHD95_05600 [Candidatus ainarchaeum sp.]|nr:hypothetical protein [Candidatus ainarchaeum sp.]
MPKEKKANPAYKRAFRARIQSVLERYKPSRQMRQIQTLLEIRLYLLSKIGLAKPDYNRARKLMANQVRIFAAYKGPVTCKTKKEILKNLIRDVNISLGSAMCANEISEAAVAFAREDLRKLKHTEDKAMTVVDTMILRMAITRNLAALEQVLGKDSFEKFTNDTKKAFDIARRIESRAQG